MIALYFAFTPYFQGIENVKENPELFFKSVNSTLIFMGLGISFSSLQDTTKTQNKLSKKIWEHPVKGKMMILFMCFMIVFLLLFGLIGYYKATQGVIKDISIGTIVLGLGMLGLLKAAVEMFEHHRKDKNKD
ncbi:hypothetical protein ACFSTE_17785 [Aquimarina hainanensis]|uniref:Uncharacterized protein n=1 Tax=Aquimarina hainanensis TaxID=1578017 RepID=A0ABW5NC99_9FLAO|nr:hypothetical protein [Aquimarina sp. TRL1]